MQVADLEESVHGRASLRKTKPALSDRNILGYLPDWQAGVIPFQNGL